VGRGNALTVVGSACVPRAGVVGARRPEQAPRNVGARPVISTMLCRVASLPKNSAASGVGVRRAVRGARRQVAPGTAAGEQPGGGFLLWGSTSPSKFQKNHPVETARQQTTEACP
jgi:hypothetical protein